VGNIQGVLGGKIREEYRIRNYNFIIDIFLAGGYDFQPVVVFHSCAVHPGILGQFSRDQLQHASLGR